MADPKSHQRYRRLRICAAAVFFLTALASPAQSTLKGDKAHPARAAHWVDTRLYFGLGPADDPTKGISESAWREFLDKEVTPRFPSGLSVVNVYGQWQGKQEAAAGTVERIRSKMLVIDYPATPANNARIEAIRRAWKQRTGNQSVLKVTQPASVSF
ncbi:DUF3574 domain-containing protein [Granulicella sp. WH15]|uniref:DUF3574 domain-containing protein n=1 Tax=Granulicella sp. WH15 TaxID=2602070 RepID=UPI001366E9B7|nr:DUF3574 domain-containing protein [Granulicella sp. WH15]QHN04033.1 DUF3574 domain-containing protein [Granulicella sp. WH15]